MNCLLHASHPGQSDDGEIEITDPQYQVILSPLPVFISSTDLSVVCVAWMVGEILWSAAVSCIIQHSMLLMDGYGVTFWPHYKAI